MKITHCSHRLADWTVNNAAHVIPRTKGKHNVQGSAQDATDGDGSDNGPGDSSSGVRAGWQTSCEWEDSITGASDVRLFTYMDAGIISSWENRGHWLIHKL